MRQPDYRDLKGFMEDAKKLYENGTDYGLTPSLTGITGEELMDIQVVGESEITLSGNSYAYRELSWGIHTIAGYTIDIPAVTIAPGGGGWSTKGQVRRGNVAVGEFAYQCTPRLWRLNSVTTKRQVVGDLVFLYVFRNAFLEPPHMLGVNGYSLVLVAN